MRLLASVYGKTLHDGRRMLLGLTLGITGLLAMVVSIWPSFADQQEEFAALLESYPPAFRAAFDIEAFDATGFLKGEVFSFMLPLLLLLYAIGRGADAIAGEEERGALDLVLAQPVTRRRLVAEKAGAIATGLALLCAVAFVVLAVGAPLVGLDVPVSRIGAAVLMAYLLGVAFGALALAIGAATGRRGLALGLSAAIGVLGYVLQTLARLVPGIEGVRYASPFHYYSGADPLVAGLDAAHAGVLLGVVILLYAWAQRAFATRDLRQG